MKAIILAGGKGLRLRPLTNNTPKPLIPLGDKPLCSYQLAWLKKYGINQVIFAIGYLKEKIISCLCDGEGFGLDIAYAKEQEPLGTAGAIRNAFEACPWEKDDLFIVLNGDTLTNINLTGFFDFHKKKQSLVSLALVKLTDPLGYGLIDLDKEDRIISFDERPKDEKIQSQKGFLINAGIYLLEKETIMRIPKEKNYSFEKQLMPSLIKESLPIYGFRASGYWLDIGTLPRYLKAKQDIHKLSF